MKVLFVALALVLCALVVSAEVVKLTVDNFDSIVLDSNKNVMVKFFAPWCGHCVRMQPAYEELSNKVGDDVVIAELDATQHQAVSSKYGVRGFPTIKLFTKSDKSGKPYQGARDANSMKSFIESNI